MPKVPLPTEAPRERAYLVGVGIDGEEALLSPEDSLTELARLAETAGLKVVGSAVPAGPLSPPRKPPPPGGPPGRAPPPGGGPPGRPALGARQPPSPGPPEPTTF